MIIFCNVLEHFNGKTVIFTVKNKVELACAFKQFFFFFMKSEEKKVGSEKVYKILFSMCKKW